MADLVYPREKSLGLITLVLGLVAWLVIILATLGTALIYLLFGFIFYLFAQSGLIAWLRGTGVRLSDEQFPDLYLQYLQCCKKRPGPWQPPAFARPLRAQSLAHAQPSSTCLVTLGARAWPSLA